MINKFKELLGKVVSKQEVETQTTILQKKAGTYEVECAIDEEVVDCDEMDNPPFVGVPAPAYLEDDPWFGPAFISDANRDYMEREHEAFKEEAHKHYGTQEPENIHEVMYQKATKNQNTTTQLNPLGGSENFHQGPGGWNSGTGHNQFK